jgi:hypothetical protein
MGRVFVCCQQGGVVNVEEMTPGNSTFNCVGIRGAGSNLEVGAGAQLRREAQQLLKVGWHG